MCTSLPSSDVAEDVATASAAVAAEVNGTPPPRINPVSEAAAKRRYKYPYVASEVLSADIAPLYDAMVNSVLIMDELLGSVETTPEGQLDAFLAGHITKVCVALLSARNEQTLAHMGRRTGFVRALLSHVSVGAIADLLVHLLDAPDREPHRLMSGATEDDAPPFPAALHLLAGADVLRGLAHAAVLHALPTSANRKLLASVAELAGKDPPTPPKKQPASLPNGHGSVAGKEAPPADNGGGGPTDSGTQDHGGSEHPLGSDTILNGEEFANTNGVTPSAAADDSEGDAHPLEAPDSTDVAPGKLRAPAAQASEEAAEVAEESPSSRRMREEALSNAAVAFLGLSHRVLRLPPTDVPDALSPYASPSVVSLLVDAGLRASDGPGSAPTLLLQALGVAADLVAAPRAVMQAAAAAEENGVGGGGAQGVGDDGWGAQTAFGEPASDFSAYRGGLGETELDSSPPSDADGTTDVMDHEAATLAADLGEEAAGLELEGSATTDLDIGASLPDASDSAAVDIAGDGVSSPTSSADPEAESEASKEASALTRALELELSGRFEKLASLLVPPGQAGEETPEVVQQRGLQSAPFTSCQAQMPLGAARLKVAEFFSACLRSAGPDALQVLSTCQVPKTLLSLFTRHEWSSMLHGVVSSAVIAAANSAAEHREYALRVWLDADIVGWLIRAWTRASTAPHGEEENGWSISTEYGAPESVYVNASPPSAWSHPGAAIFRRRKRRDRDVHGNVKFRPGYMGHLIQISSSLRHFLERASDEQAELSGFTPENREQFSRFCAESLDDAVALEGRVLGGERPPGGVGSEGEEVFEASRMFDLGGVELQKGEEVSDDLDSSEVVLRLQRMQMPSHDGFGDDDLGSAQVEPTFGDVNDPAQGEKTVDSIANARVSEQPALQQDYDDDEEEEVGSYAAFKRVSRQSATLTPSGDAIATDVPLPRPRWTDGPGKFPLAFRAESREELTNQLIQIAAARQVGSGGSSGEAKGAVALDPEIDLDVDADTAVTPVEVDHDSPDTGAVEPLNGSLRAAAAIVADDDGDAVRSSGGKSPPTAVASEAGAVEATVP